MKRSIPKVFRGSIFKSQSASRFLEEIEQFFTKNEKTETSNLLTKLISMKYKGGGNIREYIMEVSNIAAKLKSLKLEIDEDLIVHLVLISFPAHFGQFKNKKRKNIKGIAKRSSKGKKPKKNEEFIYFFCKMSRHMKEQCPKYASWHPPIEIKI
ncbi:hypothetical protein CR513_25142, partial [Mucuna pruriens]